MWNLIKTYLPDAASGLIQNITRHYGYPLLMTYNWNLSLYDKLFCNNGTRSELYISCSGVTALRNYGIV